MQALPLDLPGLGADWYVGNVHKWACGPKGLGFLYASDAVVGITTPLIVSHGWGAGYASGWVWDGTRDHGPALALHTLAAWWEWVGPQAARAYCETLLREGVRVCCDAWGVGTHAPMAMYSHMAVVQLPRSALPPTCAPGKATSDHAKQVQDALHYGCRVEAPIKCLQGELWVRVSAAVYNVRSDYERLAEAVLSLRWP